MHFTAITQQTMASNPSYVYNVCFNQSIQFYACSRYTLFISIKMVKFLGSVALMMPSVILGENSALQNIFFETPIF